MNIISLCLRLETINSSNHTITGAGGVQYTGRRGRGGCGDENENDRG